MKNFAKISLISFLLSTSVLFGCTDENVNKVLDATEDIAKITGNQELENAIDAVEDTKEVIDATKEIVGAVENAVTGLNVQTELSKQENQIPVTLNKAIDGDTASFELVSTDVNNLMYSGYIKENGSARLNEIINVFGKKNSVTTRFLLIDTPETNHPSKGVQEYGVEAKEFTKKALMNAKTISLVFDKGDVYDKYNRALAYVYVDGKSLQEMLLENGLARVAYVYKPNTTLLESFKAAEQKAKSSNLNIWSIPNYVTEKGFDMSVVK